MNNAILNETRWDNRCDPRHWESNGFQGHVQYVPYFGKKSIYPKTVERDPQMDTFPMEMGRPLNTSQFGRGKDAVKSRPTAAEEESLREGQALARSAMSEVCESLMGTTLPTAYKNLRAAG